MLEEMHKSGMVVGAKSGLNTKQITNSFAIRTAPICINM